jgi:hypothetical protein
MTSDPHEQTRRAINAHFAGAAAPGRERAMRAHLPACADCRAFYDEWLLVASLDPAAPSDQERLARGLGLPVRRAPAWGLRRLSSLGGLAAATAVAIALVLLRPAPKGNGDDGSGEFVARGGAAAAPASALDVYRIAGGATESVAGTLHAGDEVAFAYRNPTGKHRLLVFAVDEHRHVFWYHPGWTEPAANSGAVPISTEPGRHELPAAIAQRYDGQRLMVHALFTDEELTVRQVEAALATAAQKDGDGKEEWEWPFSDTIDVTRAIQVEP